MSKQELDDRKKAIVNILDKNNQGKGTGFFISDQLFLTCNHVIKDFGGNIKYKTCDGKVYRAQVIKTDESCDSALCKTDIKNASFFKLRHGVSELNTKKYYHTHGFIAEEAMPIGTDDLKYNSVTERKKLKLFLMDNAKKIYNGHSGAPIWDEDGYVVGMVTRYFDLPHKYLSESCLAIRSKELDTILPDKDTESRTDFKKTLVFYKENSYMYQSIVKKIKEGNEPILFIGDTVSEFITGGKESFINCIFDGLNGGILNYDEDDRTKYCKGELGLSLENLPENVIKFSLINELDEYLNKEVDDAKFEYQVALYVACFNIFIRFLPDKLMKYIVEKFDVPHSWLYVNSKTADIINGVTYTYTLCYRSQEREIYLYKDFDEHILNNLTQWISGRPILYVGIDFDEKELDLVDKINKNTDANPSYAFVACDENNDEIKVLSEKLTNANIMPVIYNSVQFDALNILMHKLLVDTGNKKFEKLYTFLDFRYSWHSLIGREKEMEWLNHFLISTNDNFSYAIVHGGVCVGKSRLMYDFVRMHQSDWDCYYVHYANIDSFFEDEERPKRINKNVLIVFDDFDLKKNRTQIFMNLIRSYSNTGYEVRVIFVCCVVNDLLGSADEDRILEIKRMNKEDITKACIGYAKYLQIRADKANEMNRLVHEIEKEVGSLCNWLGESEPIILYLCLSKTLELLGLIPGNKTFDQYAIHCIEKPSAINVSGIDLYPKYEEIFNYKYNYLDKNKKNRTNIYQQYEITDDDRSV